MKQTMKKLMAVLLVMALAIGVAQTTQGTTAQAASKLTGKDFKFTSNKKAYKDAMNYVYSGSDSGEYASYLVSVDVVGEKSPKKVIKTKRGITLLSTKSQVFKKYGKVTLKKLNKSNLYTYAKNGYNGYNASKKTLNILKNSKCAVYQYKRSKIQTYFLCFFFNSKNKVQCIAVFKNYESKI